MRDEIIRAIRKSTWVVDENMSGESLVEGWIEDIADSIIEVLGCTGDTPA